MRNLALLALSAALLTGCQTPSFWPAPALSPPSQRVVAPPWQGYASGQVKEFSLDVTRVAWELALGKVVQAYAYNGTVPGPELRVADHPGKWMLRGLGLDQTERGLAIDVLYDGHERDPAQDFSPDAPLRPMRYGDLAGPPHPQRPDRTYDLTLSAAMMGMVGDADTWTINGKTYPKTNPIDVRPGQRVRLKLTNMSMLDHPMHLHGHSFQIVAIGRKPVDGPLKDTITVRHMETYEIEFVADNPGTWLFHCHNLVHMAGGLMAEVRYR